MRVEVGIIPDERQILTDFFGREIYYGEDHADVYQEFSNKYHLGYSFSRNDSQYASLEIARIGHFSYKIENDSGILIFYLPEKVTNRQQDYFMQHLYEFSQWKMIGAYSIENIDGEEVIQSLHGLNEIKEKVQNKNSFFNQNLENDINVKR